MPKKSIAQEKLLAENEDLRVRLDEAEETLRAIRGGEVDGLVVSGVDSEEIFTHKSVDRAYRVLIENMNEGALTLAPDGVILYANRHFAEMLKMPLQKVIGSIIHTWIAPDGQEILQSLLRKGVVEDRRGQLELTDSDGVLVPVSLSACSLSSNEESDCFGLVATDLTEQKRSDVIAASEKLAKELLAASKQSRLALQSVIEDQQRAEKEIIQLAKFPGENPNPVLRLAQDGVVIYANESSRTLLEYWECAEGERVPEQWRERITQVLDLTQSETFEEEIADRALSVSLTPVPEMAYVNVYGLDITDRKRAKEELQKYREHLEELVVERTSELEQANRVTHAINEIFQKTLTCGTEEKLGKICLDVAEKLTGSKFGRIVELDPGWDVCDIAVADVEQSIKNMEIRGIDHSTIREGKSHIVNGDEMAGHPEITAFLSVPLKREGKTIGFVDLGNKEGGYELADQEAVETLSVAIVEVLFSKRAELTLRNVREQLVRKEHLSVLGELAGGVGHELRNPLGVISNAVYYLNITLPEADETTREYLGIISSEVRNAEKIVSALLSLSCTRSVERKEIAVSALVAQVLEKQPAPENVEVATELPVDLLPVFVNAGQIAQVLSNLVSNACQAMPDGGTLAIKAKNVENRVEISVIDTGCGMSAETMGKMFEPLYTTKTRGIGLGMTVSKNLVEINDGSIGVESHEGIGAALTVELPGRMAYL
jgi:PAS domain S-box-containing protein